MTEELTPEFAGEPEAQPVPGLTQERAWRGLIILMGAAFCIELAIGMGRLAVQFLGIKCGASPMMLGVYGTAMAGTYGLMAPVSGRVSDRFGRKISILFISILAAAGLLIAVQKTALGVLFIVPVFAGSLGFFWPPVQAWIGDLVSGTGKLHRVLGNFNLLWTTALMLGPPLCGYLWEKSTFAPFLVASVIIWASAAVMLFLVPVRRRKTVAATEAHEPADADDRTDPRADKYLRLAWAANFVGYSSVGIVRSLFPKLAVEMGFSPAMTGWATGAFCAGQLMAFTVLRQTTKWQYRRAPMIIGMAGGALGMGGAYFGRSPAIFVASFVVAGAAVGFAYVGSLFYSLCAPQDRRGRRCGIHEMMVGAGGALGPLLAGTVATYYGVRESFGVEGLIFAAAMVVFASYSVSARLRSST